MNTIQNNSIDILKVSEQIDVLLFQALECPSESGVFSLIEIAMEKNNQIKKWLSSEQANNSCSPQTHSGFPLRLKRAMKAAGLTQKELAERAGVSQSVISRLITGKDKTGTQSGVLSHALGVSFNWLHYGTGEMYSANFSANNREV